MLSDHMASPSLRRQFSRLSGNLDSPKANADVVHHTKYCTVLYSSAVSVEMPDGKCCFPAKIAERCQQLQLNARQIQKLTAHTVRHFENLNSLLIFFTPHSGTLLAAPRVLTAVAPIVHASRSVGDAM